MSVQKARSMRSRRTGSDPLAAALRLVRDFFFGWQIAAAELTLARFPSRLLWVRFLLTLGEGCGLPLGGTFFLFEAALERSDFRG